MLIMDICENPDVLNVIRLTKNVIGILRIAVPIILIFALLFDLIRAIMSNEGDIAQVGATATKRLVLAALIFLIPTIINIVLVAAGNNDIGYGKCFTHAEKEYIDAAYVNQAGKYVANANKTLLRGDYNTAVQQVNTLKNEGAKRRFLAELDEIDKKIKAKEEEERQQQLDKIKQGIAEWQISLYDFMWPLKEGGTLGCCFGGCEGTHQAGKHGAIDIPAGDHTPVYASRSGVVSYIGNGSLPNQYLSSAEIYANGCGGYGGCGNQVTIDHGSGIKTKYCHLYKDSITVKVGDHIAQGEQLGEVGSSGCSTGSHLHFAIEKNGIPVDPVKLINIPDSVANRHHCD